MILALGASGTDGIFSCPARNADRSLSKFVTTYAYEFNDENAAPSQSSFGGRSRFPWAPIIVQNFNTYSRAPISSECRQHRFRTNRSSSDTMISYWTQFAKTGDPNSCDDDERIWSPYSASTDEFQSLIPPTPIVESNFDTAHHCSTFWNTF